MASIDLDTLLQNISEESPCGEDLEYDPAFGELERTAQGREEQQIGDTVIEAEEPDWREVEKRSLELFSRTKDLRIALYLLRAQLHLHGYEGLRDGLNLLQGLLQGYWEGIYPELDADDNNDPTMRINALLGLCDDQMVLHPLRMAPLVSSRMLGQFSLRDIAIAEGQLQPTDEGEHVEMATIEAAFMDAELEQLQATAQAVDQSIQAVTALEGFLTEQVGVTNSISLAPLVSVLKEAQQTLAEQLVRRGVDTQTGEAESDEDGGQPGTASSQRGAALSGEINSREDVVRALDKIRDYYARNEPASPIPILVERAKRLVHMGFIEIIENMAPDGMSQIDVIRGPRDEEE